MITDASKETGLEELLRLAREVREMGKEYVQELGRARERLKRVKKKQAIRDIIKEIKVSQVLEQLDPLATSRVIQVVESLRITQNTAELRNLILHLVNELEEKAAIKANPEIDRKSLELSVKTLAILIDFLFYYE